MMFQITSYNILCFFIIGDVVNQLQHLTTSLKLDYYQFIEDYDQTFFYTAQQMEAGLKDYVPQIVLVRREGEGRSPEGN